MLTNVSYVLDGYKHTHIKQFWGVNAGEGFECPVFFYKIGNGKPLKKKFSSVPYSRDCPVNRAKRRNLPKEM